MNVLPRLLYLFQAIPIKLPASFLASFKLICRRFLWAGRPARLNWDRMTMPKMRGGLGVPDLSKYHKACLLTRIVDWHVHKEEKDWVKLEEAFVGFRISHLPWIDKKFTPRSCTSHPVIGPTLACLRKTSGDSHMASHPGPMTPLNLNPGFSEGINTINPGGSETAPTLRAHQFFDKGKLLSHSAMVRRFPDFQIPRFKYFHIRNFFLNSQTSDLWCRDLSHLEKLCESSAPQRHLISGIYLWLTPQETAMSTIHTKWEADLQVSLSDGDWSSIWNHIHKGSINVSAQENRYKIYSRWYRTPSKLHKFYPTVSPTCWRCGGEVGTLLHIWWSCSKLQPFWQEVHSHIAKITSYTPDFTPGQYLLHHTSLPQSIYRKSLVLHLINAATQCIPIRWKDPIPPTLLDWQVRVDKIEMMDRLIHQANDNSEKFRHIWRCWTLYRTPTTHNST